ncbi:hypothetical protein PG990_014561 [Apiospora arundinis]|uniref:Uncharacterized protein n=1 Tax=Apiospora arundinis TaxID=335852 RepID=A0ABR2HJJ8_9PEZI
MEEATYADAEAETDACFPPPSPCHDAAAQQQQGLAGKPSAPPRHGEASRLREKLDMRPEDLERRLALLEDNIRLQEQALQDMRRELQDMNREFYDTRRIPADLHRRISTLNDFGLPL